MKNNLKNQFGTFLLFFHFLLFVCFGLFRFFFPFLVPGSLCGFAVLFLHKHVPYTQTLTEPPENPAELALVETSRLSTYILRDFSRKKGKKKREK